MPGSKTSRTRLLLASNVRKFRKALDLSQEDLADLAGLHRTYIGSIERGKQNISIDNVEKLADALKISVAQLLTEPQD